jgi:hypothetical protein
VVYTKRISFTYRSTVDSGDEEIEECLMEGFGCGLSDVNIERLDQPIVGVPIAQVCHCDYCEMLREREEGGF